MKRILISILSCYLMMAACSQKEAISTQKRKKIDALLEGNQGSRPGYALGIVQNGELVYSMGYGKSNLDYDLPITDTTSFYIGSMAKQFTAAVLLILESEGKIDLNEPLRSYFKELPIYDNEITINHLIHHTSGIRETNSLQLFEGIDRKFEETFNTEDLIDLILKQKELNFNPGSEYRYSSGGYALLAKIIEMIENKPFRQSLEERIFYPLGMKNTFVSDNHNEVVPNRAVSYWPISGGKFERRSQLFDAYGDGGIITTVKDLAKWDGAFYKDVLGVPQFSKKMYQKYTLKNGDTIDYARALNVWNYKGAKVVQHNGGMLGFRVDMVRFPKYKTSIILLGNSAFLDPTGDALKIAEILLEDTFDFKIKEKPLKEKSAIQLTKKELTHKTGVYWTDQTNYWRRISISNDSLFLDGGNLNEKQYLIPISKNRFCVESNPNLYLDFEPAHKLRLQARSIVRTFRRFDPTPPSKIEEVEPYTGTYTSKELSSTYHIFKEENRLFLSINNKRDIQIFPQRQQGEVIWNGSKMLWIGFAEIKFDFGDKGIVQGFTIGDSRVSGVKFNKMITTKS